MAWIRVCLHSTPIFHLGCAVTLKKQQSKKHRSLLPIQLEVFLKQVQFIEVGGQSVLTCTNGAEYLTQVPLLWRELDSSSI
jgi:hypothetical protein